LRASLRGRESEKDPPDDNLATRVVLHTLLFPQSDWTMTRITRTAGAIDRTAQSVRSAWTIAGWVLIAFVFWESLARNPISVRMPEGDKYSHVLAYATLMFWFAQLHTGKVRIACAVAFVAMGVDIEFLQRLTGYRTFEIADMVAAAIGVSVGWLLAPPRSPSLLRYIEGVASRLWPANRSARPG